MRLTFKPVDVSNKTDFERLFESKGGPKYCWCMAWRNAENGKTVTDSARKKEAMLQKIMNGTPVGILGYLDNEPVAWCSVAPRETYKALGGDETKSNVWSLVCFFIKRTCRNEGITGRLLKEAEKYAARHGANYLEAYPVSPDAPSYRFMGFVPTFEKAGFRFVKMAGTRRHVMLKTIKQPLKNQ